MEHLFARYREIRPLFFVPALPMNAEWNIRPYLGVFPLVFRALQNIFKRENINNKTRKLFKVNETKNK